MKIVGGFAGLFISFIVCFGFFSCNTSEAGQIQDITKKYLETLYKLDYTAIQKYVVPDNRKGYAETGESMSRLKKNKPEQFKKLLEMSKNITVEWKGTKYNQDSTRATVAMNCTQNGTTKIVTLDVRKVEGEWYVK